MKSHVTMEQKVCPACGKPFDTGAILLDRKVRQVFDNKTVTGFSFCPDDQAKIDEGYVILVAIDKEKSTDFSASGVYRTGAIAYIKREVAEDLFKVAPGTPLVWTDPKVNAELEKYAAGNNG